MNLDPKLIAYAATAAIIVLVLFVRLRAASKPRILRPDYLWVVPTLYACLVGVVLTFWPPLNPLAWGYVGAGALAGAAFGWWRGSMTVITKDGTTGQLMQQAGAAALLVIPVLIAARIAFREYTVLEGDATLVHLATDILVVFMFGVLALQRIEMFLRARRLR